MRSLALLAVFCCAGPVAAQAGKAKPAPRPNILVICADDWSWPHAGVYGDKVVKAPNFDRLARQGMLFHRAYTIASTCTPSRAGMLTGQAIHRLQEGGNLHGTLPQRYPVYPDLLERAGYFVGLFGKGWGPGNFEEGGRTRNPAGPRFKSFAAFLKARPADRPFVFWFGSTKPHRPYTLGAGVKAGLKPEDVKVPPFWPDTPKFRSDILDYYSEVQGFDAQVGEVLRLLDEAGLAENTLVFVISDNGMPFPRCKANVYEYSTHMPLAVRWPGRVKAGSESRAFISFTDLAPTILQAAGLKVPADMTGRSFLDVLTTGKDPADRDRVFVERERHANVRKGDLSYPVRAVRTADFLYVRNLRPDRWPAGDPELYFAVGPFGDVDDGPTKREVMALQNGDKAQRRLFELSLGKRPAEELYDLKKDPWEMNNVADKPEYAKAKAKMRAALDKWMADTGDPRATEGGGDDRWDRFKYFGAPSKKEKRQAPLRPAPRPAVGEVGEIGSIPPRCWPTEAGPMLTVQAANASARSAYFLRRGLCGPAGLAAVSWSR
jgi:arylsulfatase A-like enzyme